MPNPVPKSFWVDWSQMNKCEQTRCEMRTITTTWNNSHRMSNWRRKPSLHWMGGPPKKKSRRQATGPLIKCYCRMDKTNCWGCKIKFCPKDNSLVITWKRIRSFILLARSIKTTMRSTCINTRAKEKMESPVKLQMWTANRRLTGFQSGWIRSPKARATSRCKGGRRVSSQTWSMSCMLVLIRKTS